MTALVAPARMRSAMAEEHGLVRVQIPARRNWAIIIILGIWLCGWAGGEILFPYSVLRGAAFSREGARGPPAAFLIFWFMVWTAFGAGAIYTWVWNVFGREVVEIDARALTVRRAPIPFPPSKQYDLLHVRNLRVVPFESYLWWMRDPFAGMRGGPLAFDYGAKTIRFGAGIDEAEARMVLDSIRTRFPELGS